TRILPSSTCCFNVPGAEAIACTVPLSKAVSAGPAPRDGTCSNLMPALAANISIGTSIVPEGPARAGRNLGVPLVRADDGFQQGRREAAPAPAARDAPRGRPGRLGETARSW